MNLQQFIDQVNQSEAAGVPIDWKSVTANVLKVADQEITALKRALEDAAAAAKQESNPNA